MGRLLAFVERQINLVEYVGLFMDDLIPTAALIVEVRWGIIPGQAEGQERWGFTREQVETMKSWEILLIGAYEEFNRRMNPNYHNWVTMSWIWL